MPRAIAARIILLALGAGVVADISVPGNAVGLNGLLLTAFLLVSSALIAGLDGIRRMDVADAWLAPAALFLSGMAAVRADPWLVDADILLAAALAGGTVASLGGARITRGLVPHLLLVTVGVTVAAFVGAFEVLVAMRRMHAPETAVAATADVRTARQRARRFAPVARGLLVAIPLVVVFTALFSSADAVFDRVAHDVLSWRLDVDLAGAADRAAVVTAVAWLVAGALALAGARLPALAVPDRPARSQPMHRSPGATGGIETGAGATGAVGMADGGRLGTVEAATVLIVLDSLFAVFVVLQLAYLFGGRDTMSAAGMTYAAYARRGFFELVAVAALAGAIAVALDLAVARRSRIQVGASFGLLALTIVVLASALVRLRLYQDAYGWTELRFVVLVAIGWLAVAIIATLALLAARRPQWTLHVLGIMTVMTVGGMNLIGPQAYVTDRNLERAIDPSLVPSGGRSGLDADYLISLGDEAVPAVIAALDRLPDAGDQGALEVFLLRRAAVLREDPSLAGWPSWNLARERAREALAAWEGGRAD